MSRTSAITVSRSKRGTTIKASGKSAAALFDAMCAGLPDAAVAPGAVVCTLHLEDHGQDFLEWDLDAQHQVVGCRPHQAFVWRGRQLARVPMPGERCELVKPDGSSTWLHYPVAKVVVHMPAGGDTAEMSP